MAAETTSNFWQQSPENPLFNAAGLLNGWQIKTLLRDVERLASSPIGGLTVGSWTLERRLGHAALYGEPVEHYDEETGLMTNSLGLPNVGIRVGERYVPEIIELAADKPVIFSVSPAPLETGSRDAVRQAVLLIDRLLAAGAQLVELNVSCPNLIKADQPQLNLGYDTEALERLAQALRQHPDYHQLASRLGLKLPPYLEPAEVSIQSKVATILKTMPLAFVTVCNTIANQRPTDHHGRQLLSVPGGRGGGSGPATTEIGRQQLERWQQLLPADLPVISALGVYDGQEILKRRQLGAFTCAVNTRLWRSSNWQQTVTELLIEYGSYR